MDQNEIKAWRKDLESLQTRLWAYEDDVRAEKGGQYSVDRVQFYQEQVGAIRALLLKSAQGGGNDL